MRLSRYIIKKPKNAPEEKDAADYEKCSDFFITDQTTTTQNHYEPGNLPRDRYGVGSFFPQNYLVIDDEGEFFGVPVHDACWKIFERVSKLRLGRVDLQGFMALWYRSACGTCGFQTIKQEPIVNECKQQFWSHVPGTEYLAANPHDIVGFSRMALESYHYAPRHRRNDQGVYMGKPCCRIPPRSVYVNPTDPFSKLPLEIKNMILFNLQAKDIGSLRYVSRGFHQLSQQVFRHLILKELPWFWEIDELQQRKLEQTRKMYVIQFGDGLSRLEEGNWDDEHKQFVKDCVALKPQSLDWKAIYDRVKILQKGILGVRNRARIWELVERITERIGKLRESSSSQKRYDLRDEEDLLSARATIEEMENDLVNEGFDCLDCHSYQIERIVNDCQTHQIERMADDEEMEDQDY